MTALEEEAVKALTGRSKMNINSLIPKRCANLEKARAEAERIRTEIENDAKLDELYVREIKTIRSWAETFEVASGKDILLIISHSNTTPSRPGRTGASLTTTRKSVPASRKSRSTS